MNTPMHMDDPERLLLIAERQPEMLLPHHWKKLQEYGDRMKTIAMPTSDVQPDQADRQAA